MSSVEWVHACDALSYIYITTSTSRHRTEKGRPEKSTSFMHQRKRFTRFENFQSTPPGQFNHSQSSPSLPTTQYSPQSAMASIIKHSGKASKGKGRASDATESAAADAGPIASTSNGTGSGSSGAARRKDKVLMLSSRGVTGRMRHLMNDLEVLLPHIKKGELRDYSMPIGKQNGSGVKLTAVDSKLDSKSSLHLINEVSDLHSCNNTLYFEARRHEDLYLWISRSPNGPSAKCHVQNIHTMDELKMTGNCLKGSRGLVCFDGGWDESSDGQGQGQGEEWKGLMKEMLTHVSWRRKICLAFLRCGI